MPRSLPSCLNQCLSNAATNESIRYRSVINTRCGWIRAAVAKAEELAAQPGYFWARQFDNEATQLSTIKQIKQEIIKAFDLKPQMLVSGIGTGGTTVLSWR